MTASTAGTSGPDGTGLNDAGLNDAGLHGDSSMTARAIMRAKDVVKRALASGTPAPVLGVPYLVVPVLGQSNAHGAGRGEATGPHHERVHQWPGCGRPRRRILLAHDPLLHDTPGAGRGFATTFGALLAERTGRPVLLVPCARGDTSFHPKNGFTWDVDDTETRVNLARNAHIRIAEALALVPGSTLAAVLWHQGESDVPLTPPDRYRDALDRLIVSTRQRVIGGDDVPFLVGGMVPEEIETGHPRYPGIDAVHREMPSRHRRTAFVEGPRGSHNDGETIHYDASGQVELGRRYFAAVEEWT